jgi:hypothetical protein
VQGKKSDPAVVQEQRFKNIARLNDSGWALVMHFASGERNFRNRDGIKNPAVTLIHSPSQSR